MRTVMSRSFLFGLVVCGGSLAARAAVVSGGSSITVRSWFEGSGSATLASGSGKIAAVITASCPAESGADIDADSFVGAGTAEVHASPDACDKRLEAYGGVTVVSSPTPSSTNELTTASSFASRSCGPSDWQQSSGASVGGYVAEYSATGQIIPKVRVTVSAYSGSFSCRPETEMRGVPSPIEYRIIQLGSLVDPELYWWESTGGGLWSGSVSSAATLTGSPANGSATFDLSWPPQTNGTWSFSVETFNFEDLDFDLDNSGTFSAMDLIAAEVALSAGDFEPASPNYDEVLARSIDLDKSGDVEVSDLQRLAMLGFEVMEAALRGDYDGSGVVDWCDVSLVDALIGSGDITDSDSGYSALADFNLNGVIDDSDLNSIRAGLVRRSGDANADGDVDFDDQSAVLVAWGTSPGPWGYGDANGDGSVNFDDVNAVIVGWGPACP